MKIHSTTIQQQFKLSVFTKLMVFISSILVFSSVAVLAFAQTEKRIANWQLMPKIDYTYWCVPTSQTMILGYYDNYVQGVGGFGGYGRLIDYWFDHPPYTSGSSPVLHKGSNTPSYIDVIIDPNTATWRLKPDGTSWSSPESFHMDNFGYSFSFQGVDCNDDNGYCWNEIKSEIDNNRPLFFSGPGHTTAAFGYQITAAGQKKVIVYNPPNPNTPTYIDYIDYDWCTGIQKVIPLEEENSDNLVIFSPDGGEELTQLDPYEITWYIYGNTIKSVDIDHSTDGGNTWKSVATGIGAQSGTNSRFWTPTVTTNDGRIRIRGYSQDRSEYIAGDGSQDNFRVNTATGDELNWCSCSWQEIGPFKSHQDLENWCPPGSFLTQLDLDQCEGATGSDSPIVGRARCCKLCDFEADSWGSCSWVEIGYDKSHFQMGNWCPDGSFLTQLDLDGDTSHGDSNGPVVVRAKCCTMPDGQFQKWGTSYWQEVGAFMSHGDRGNWCPHGTFLTQLDLDGVAALSVHDSPVVGRCKCARPAQGVIIVDLPATGVILNTVFNVATVTISGGSAPYTIQTVPDSAIATAELSGTVLTITAVGDGSTSMVIADSQAETITIPITVGAGGGAQDPPGDHNVGMCDTICQAGAPMTVASGVMDVNFDYTAPVEIIAGVMSEYFTSVWWLTDACTLSTDFEQAASAEQFICTDLAMPAGSDHCWVFWMVAPTATADLGYDEWWNTGAYELMFYQLP